MPRCVQGSPIEKKKEDVTSSGSQADVKSGINKTNTSEASFSVFFLCLSLALSSCIFVCCCYCVSCCGVCAVCVCGVRHWKNTCVRAKRPRVYRHHAHMLKHMCAWCQQTRKRCERTHEVHGRGGGRRQPRIFHRENKQK